MNSPTDRPEGPGYEVRDVDPRVIGWLVGSIAGVLALSMVGLWLYMENFVRVAARDESRPALAADQTPPEPRLQSAPHQDFAAFLAEQEQELNSYGWVDREAGTVRIPIADAMDLALKRKIFSAPAEATPEDAARPSEEAP